VALPVLQTGVRELSSGGHQLSYPTDVLTREAVYVLHSQSLIDMTGRSGARLSPMVQDELFALMSDNERRRFSNIARIALGGRIEYLTAAALAVQDRTVRLQWAQARITQLDLETGVLTSTWANYPARAGHADRLLRFAESLAFGPHSDLSSDAVATFLTRVAFVLSTLHRCREAEPLFAHARRVRESVGGREALSESLALEADNLDRLGRPAEARVLLQRALVVLRARDSSEQVTSAWIHNTLGLSFLHAGATAEAEAQFHEVLRSAEALRDSSLIGAAYHNLACVHERLGDAFAGELFEKALAALVASGISWMTDHVRRDVARSRARSDRDGPSEAGP
jgi:tetratricopeptide (TPR) repeat protein